MKKSLFTLALMALFAVAWASNNDSDGDTEKAETISISGHISDQETNEALVGVKVTLEGTDEVVYTDFDGTYTFEDITPGVYNLCASYISYQKENVDKIEVGSNSNQVNISLKTSN